MHATLRRKIAIITLVLGLTTMGVSAVQMVSPELSAVALERLQAAGAEGAAAEDHAVVTLDTETCIVARCLHKQKRDGKGGLLGMLRAGGSVAQDIGPSGRGPSGALSPPTPFAAHAARPFGS